MTTTETITVTLTTDQAYRILDLLQSPDDVDHFDYAIEREIDSALLTQEMDVDPDEHALEQSLRFGYNPEDVPQLTQEMDDAMFFDNTCIWLMEDFDEDGPTTRECGRLAAVGELRPYCPWHASALDMDAMEFEDRVEAGETWSR